MAGVPAVLGDKSYPIPVSLLVMNYASNNSLTKLFFFLFSLIVETYSIFFSAYPHFSIVDQNADFSFGYRLVFRNLGSYDKEDNYSTNFGILL